VGIIKDIGRRVEIVNLDRFGEITIALYQQMAEGGAVYRVHSYSSIEGAGERISFVRRVMRVLGGMEVVDGEVEMLRFGCGHAHLSLVKILFLRACKVDPEVAVETLGLGVADPKSGQEVSFESIGAGGYALSGSGEDEKDAKRLRMIRKLMVKHGEMDLSDESAYKLRFGCGLSHDELAGVLLAHAVKVRVSALAG